MLDLYKNIRDRRLELRMSQEELAKKTGYTSRSSIAKIEKGLVDLSQSKIVTFAEALSTSPADLLGESYYSGKDGSAPNQLEKFRNSLFYKDTIKYKNITDGYYQIINGIYDSIKEFDQNGITYILLTLGEKEFSVTYDFFYDLQDSVEEHIKMMIEQFSKLNRHAKIQPTLIPNAAHERTDIEATDEMRKHDDDIMNDDSEWE